MWKLKKIHRVGELSAAIAVVVSLIFVGIEVQQNNQIQKQQATRSLVRDWSNAAASYQDPEISCLWIRLMNDRENLTLQEATQIESVIWRLFRVDEELHYQYEQGMIDESVWSGFSVLIARQAAFEGYRVWWSGYQNTFSPRYRKYMDDVLATTPVDPNPYFLDMKCDTPVGKDYWREYN